MYKLLALAIIVSYFIYHGVTGQRGIISTIDIDEKILEGTKKLNTLQKERSLIEYKIRILRSGSTDHDLIDEVIRRGLGMADPNEVVIIIKKNNK